VPINTRIPQELLDEIDQLARERGVPRAVIIRELLEEGVRRRRSSDNPTSPID
jgi:metal-responsive CopG/Arc/MetJ family transcriptional regulator